MKLSTFNNTSASISINMEVQEEQRVEEQRLDGAEAQRGTRPLAQRGGEAQIRTEARGRRAEAQRGAEARREEVLLLPLLLSVHFFLEMNEILVSNISHFYIYNSFNISSALIPIF